MSWNSPGSIKIILFHSLMINREPFDLHKFIVVYNVYQILACASYMRLLVKSGVKFWGVYCPETWYMAPQLQYNIGLYGFWLKASEMTETVVFLLRKKNKQVTNLHVFHHCITVTFLYFSVAYDFSELNSRSINFVTLFFLSFFFRKRRVLGSLHQLFGPCNYVLLLPCSCVVQRVQSSQHIEAIINSNPNHSICDCAPATFRAQGLHGMSVSDLLHSLLYFWFWSVHLFLCELL